MTLLGDYTFRLVTLGSALLGALAGLLGVFAVLRRQSLLGDAVSHAALPGIALAFLLTGQRTLPVLLGGAAVTGLLAAAGLSWVTRQSRVRPDAALGITLSVYFGAGLVLLTFLQKQPNAAQAGLDRFLFGQASAILEREVLFMAIPAVACLVLILLWWKEFAFVTFDRDSAAVQGLPVRRLELLLSAMTVAAVVVGLQMVGVVLMSALLVAPAAAARQWTDRLPVMAVLAAFFGALGGAGGTLLSSLIVRMPTGPTVVLVLIGMTFVSLLLAPRRGLLWGTFRRWRDRGRLQREAVLADLWALSRQHPRYDHPHAASAIAAMREGSTGVTAALSDLAARGWVQRLPDRRWALTEAGLHHAEEFLVQTGGRP